MANRHVVILGAGMAGLFAARVLSDVFERVTVIDRDALPAEPDGRRGVPQGRHVHGFQSRGVQILDELFPGLLDELSAAGASRIDNLSDLHFRVGGHLICRQPYPIAPVLLATRAFLEHSVRRRVQALYNVDVFRRLDVTGLVADGAVTGVRVVPSGGGATDEIRADLVVDATGRGSRAPVWLEELGYDRPVEERIKVRIKYASQLLRFPSGEYPTRFVIEGRTPTRNPWGALFRCERDTWLFSVVGTGPDVLTATRESMLDVARDIMPAWTYEALRAAEPVSAVAYHQHPASVRRRYDLLSRFPSGFVVLGDAICAFNPIYGQGMSVAAEQALALRRALAHPSDDLPLRYLRAAGKPVATAWDLTAGPDLAYPETDGAPTPRMRRIGGYVNRVLTVAERDPEVARRFLAVSGLAVPPTALFGPRVLGPVLRSALGGGASGTSEEAAREPVATG
jgi:2-polyprenyl-6-methoxyphenol hydroxylase-like FAD-dependent oxidoreductase